MAEVNVTPLLDLAFVLLIIFMITAPLLRQGMELVIPGTKSAQETVENERIVTISIFRSGNLAINGIPTNSDQLPAQLRQLLEAGGSSVVVEAHRDLPVQILVDTMETARMNGAGKVGIITRQKDD
jgi:biopolymer transport protein ExbD